MSTISDRTNLVVISTSIHDIINEPAGATYAGLIRFTVTYCETFSLIDHPDGGSSTSFQAILANLAPWLIEETVANEWPGTISSEPMVRMYLYKLDDGSALQLLEASVRLFQWEQPELPEDLAIYRASGKPLLGSTSHEYDAWLDLSDDELNLLMKEVPALELRKHLR